MSAPAGPRPAGLALGIGSVSRALGFLRTHRRLWGWCALPLALNLLAFGLALALFLANLDAIAAPIEALFATADPAAWYEWLWIGPLRALGWVSRWILVGLFGFVIYASFTLIGAVLAAPFLDTLSRRVEQLARGRLEPSKPSESSLEASSLESVRAALRDSLGALVEEAKRIGFFAAVQAVLLALGWVPGLQLPAAAAALAFAALFLPLEYTGYVLDRRGVSFRERRRWLWRHRTAMIGFGATALLTFFVPGLNFLCLPWLVTAGTLLALDVGPPD